MSVSVVHTFGECPTWCVGQHGQAMDEGCTFEEAAVHSSPDLAGLLNDLMNPYTGDVIRPARAGYNVRVRAAGDDRFPGLPTVDLEIHEWRGESADRDLVGIDLHLTGGEARTLARQLEHYADLADLHT